MKNLFFRRATLVCKKPSRVWLSSSHVVRPKGLILTDKGDLGYEANKGVRREDRFEKISANLCSIKWWHTRHRSLWNFLTNLMEGLLSYTLQKEKPSLNLRDNDRKLLSAIC